MKADENFKFIFRESKINDAILFFDECEAIFESRNIGGSEVNLLLTEIERYDNYVCSMFGRLFVCVFLSATKYHHDRHDGLIILATNRPYDLDEAMHRRIMVAIEFSQPDHLLRKLIWESHMPEQMKLTEDVDLVSARASDNHAMQKAFQCGFKKVAI